MSKRAWQAAALVALAALLAALPWALRELNGVELLGWRLRTFPRYLTYLLSLWALLSAAAIGLNLTLGYAGQISLGQAAFLGIGAYCAALFLKWGVGFWPAVPAAALVCFVLGLALGFPALRVQHHYLAFVTLGFNALVFLVLRNEEWLTGGNFGIQVARRMELFGFSLRDPIDYARVCLVVLAVVGGVVAFVLRSPWGRAFAALRDNPIRAESLGVDIRAYTLLAFAIGAACAGVAGVFYAPLLGFVDPTPFTPFASIFLLLMVILGGSGRFFGPPLGAAVAVVLQETLQGPIGDWYLVVFGVLVVVLMAWSPGGLLALGARGGGR